MTAAGGAQGSQPPMVYVQQSQTPQIVQQGQQPQQPTTTQFVQSQGYSPFTSQVSSATFIKTLRLRAVDKLPFWLIEPLKLTAHIFNSIEFFQQLPANLASSSRTTIPNPPTSRPELVTLSSSDDIPNPPTTRPELVTLSSSDDIVSLMNSPPARGQTSSSDYVDVRVYEKLMYKCLIV